MLIFLGFVAVRFHTSLFASETETVNKTTHVLRSSIHWTEILKQGKQEVQKQANHALRPNVQTIHTICPK